MGKKDGIESFLKVLSVRVHSPAEQAVVLRHGSQQYRRKDPVDADETEFMENVFDALCSALSEQSIKGLFLKAEGPDLMLLMMKSVIHCGFLASF